MRQVLKGKIRRTKVPSKEKSTYSVEVEDGVTIATASTFTISGPAAGQGDEHRICAALDSVGVLFPMKCENAEAHIALLPFTSNNMSSGQRRAANAAASTQLPRPSGLRMLAVTPPGMHTLTRRSPPPKASQQA